MFDDGKDQILFDAHVTRPSLKKYVKGAEVVTNTQLCDYLIKVHKMNRLRAIFISHTHHDSIGDFRIQILKSLHSKPTKLNDDLGQPITEPLVQPASLRAYKEGGSYDFYIEHGDKKYLIRPSFNYIKGQLDGFKADVLFLGVAGLAKAEKSMTDTFFEETVEKTEAKLVIPIHWDNFFSSLEWPNMEMPDVIEATELVFFKLAKYCESKDVNCLIQYPCTSIEL